MNSTSWCHALPRVWLTAACLAAANVGAQPASAPPPPINVSNTQAAPATFQALLDQIWQRHPDAVSARNATKQAEALNQVAHSWIAGQPSATLAQTEGLSALGREQRATELGLSAPVWLWGQRSQQQAQARAAMALADAQVQLTRWRLAKELHERAVAVWLNGAEVAQFATQVQTMTALDADVQRRVRAGDLAPADALASQAELLSLQSQWRAAQQAALAAKASWRSLVGDIDTPEPGTWPVASSLPATAHPLLMWHAAQTAAVQAKRRLIEDRWSAQPELAITVKQEGSGGNGSQNRSATVAVSVPWGGSVHRQPELVAALAELDRAEAEARQAELDIDGAYQTALAALNQMQEQAATEAKRAQLLLQRATWLNKSFQAGETDLPELLRAQAAAAQASASFAQTDIQRRAAQVRLQLAQGNLP